MEQAVISEEIPLYNSRVIDTYIKLIKRKYSHVNLGELLRHAKMEPYEVADQGHWFTQEQIDRFYEKLVQVTGNDNIAREAGRYAASPEALGIMRQYVLSMIGPLTLYETFGKIIKNFTKSASYEVNKLSGNKVEIAVRLNEGVQEKHFQCENRIGFFEAISLVFDYKAPRIEHPECMFKGGHVCRYIISWENPFSAIWKKTRNFTAFFLFCICMICVFYNPIMTLTALFPISMLVTLLLNSISERIEKTELRTSLNNLRDSTDELMEQININYNNALMTNEIGQTISRQTHIEDILDSVIQISKKRLDYDRGLILLANPEKTRLEFRAGFGYSDNQRELLEKTSFHLDRPESKGAFVVSFRAQKPLLINDINEIEGELSTRSLTFARQLGTKSFVCTPIVADREALGILAVDNLKSKKPLVESDLSLLIGIASVLGISIRNAELLEARERQFRSILSTLAASIDARDPLTAGHSEKVTEYAVSICQELGLSKEYQEMIQVAALLHDYGKIGVPDAILKKPGRLTDEEYEIVKLHAEKTQRILQQINFEGVFSQVPEIAGSHHEKIDGSGYPNGLKGDEIPFGAKIIAVADFFEAVTARRHYRGPIPIEKAITLLEQERGVHFEESIVDAFFSYYFRSTERFGGKTGS
jgi:HD-GYP domain-containing protein (c-di-GMP phosphodiesterase class II)